MVNVASRTIKRILSLFVLALAAIYLYFFHEDFKTLLSIEATEILGIVLLNFAFFVATGITFALLVAMVRVRLSVLEVLSLTFLTNFVNYLGPVRPGAAVKAVYLKSEKHLNLAQFAAVLTALEPLLGYLMLRRSTLGWSSLTAKNRK